MFWENFLALCMKDGTSPNAIAKKLGISSGAVTKWKKEKSIPHNTTLKKIADYFGVAPETLLNDSTTTPTGSSLDIELSTLTAKLIKSDDEWTKQFVVKFLKLSPASKEMFKRLLADISTDS
ncbi:MAG: helix-turn-helix transcriptional regulator [Clostridia bacterium]|nr:helix-turn-helix transcriptional regulator [Clostridia bacterium]